VAEAADNDITENLGRVSTGGVRAEKAYAMAPPRPFQIRKPDSGIRHSN